GRRRRRGGHPRRGPRGGHEPLQHPARLTFEEMAVETRQPFPRDRKGTAGGYGEQVELRSLPPLLRAEPALAALAGSSAAVVAVPEPARAITIAGLAHLSGRHPLVVAVPTSTEAERVGHDLRAFLGAEQVDVFPAWETLPFERVSPSVDTMGRRLRALWRLG